MPAHQKRKTGHPKPYRPKKLGAETPGLPKFRTAVYASIDGERDYQDHMWGANEAFAVGEHIALLQEYVNRARQEWSTEKTKPETKTLHMIRKVAGIAVRCLERHGCPRREGW